MSTITDKTYALVEKAGSWEYGIKILEGQYAGIIYTYGTVKLVEEKENDCAKLQFTYALNEVCAPHNEAELKTSDTFRNFLGDILTHIIDTSFQNKKYRIGTFTNGKPSRHNSSKNHSR